jgi:hypothetical protein
MKFLAIGLLVTVLGGCSLLEPTATTRFSTKAGTSTEVVFNCAESTIHSLKAKRDTWSDVVTTRDIPGGIFETGKFNEVNISGMRVQIRYQTSTGDGRVKVKASGPYFVDLGAEWAAEQLASGISKCS